MKLFHRVLWLILIGLLGGVSCMPLSTERAQSTSTASAPEAKPLPQWQVRLSQSGGIAGMSRRLELDSTGALTVSDEKLARKISLTLTEDQLKDIAALVLEAQAEKQTSAPFGSACRDCFQYTLTIERNGEKIQVQADDITLDQVSLAPLINRLLELQKEALSEK